MTRAALIALIAAAALTAGCGRVSSMPRPVYQWGAENGLCGWQAAVDGTRRLWHETGCENGNPPMRRVRRIGAADLETLEAAYARLPKDRDTLTADEYRAAARVFAQITAMRDDPLSDERWRCAPRRLVLHTETDEPGRAWTYTPCPELDAPESQGSVGSSGIDDHSLHEPS